MSRKNPSIAQNGHPESVDFNALSEHFKNGALSFDELTRQMLHGLAIEQARIPTVTTPDNGSRSAGAGSHCCAHTRKISP